MHTDSHEHAQTNSKTQVSFWTCVAMYLITDTEVSSILYQQLNYSCMTLSGGRVDWSPATLKRTYNRTLDMRCGAR